MRVSGKEKEEIGTLHMNWIITRIIFPHARSKVTTDKIMFALRRAPAVCVESEFRLRHCFLIVIRWQSVPDGISV